MTDQEVRDKLDAIAEQYGGEDAVICVLCATQNNVKVPTTGSSPCNCDICGVPCWVVRPDIEAKVRQYNRKGYVLCCGMCCEASVRASQDRPHALLPNVGAAKATGFSVEEVRAFEKAWTERIGINYQDPLLDN